MRMDIDKLTEPELQDLNNRIVARLRFLREMRAHAAMLEFRIGDQVEFHPDGRPPIIGMLTRYNKKTGGERWNVAPGLLRRVAEESRSGATDLNPIRLLGK